MLLCDIVDLHKEDQYPKRDDLITVPDCEFTIYMFCGIINELLYSCFNSIQSPHACSLYL